MRNVVDVENGRRKTEEKTENRMQCNHIAILCIFHSYNLVIECDPQEVERKSRKKNWKSWLLSDNFRILIYFKFCCLVLSSCCLNARDVSSGNWEVYDDCCCDLGAAFQLFVSSSISSINCNLCENIQALCRQQQHPTKSLTQRIEWHQINTNNYRIISADFDLCRLSTE